MIGADRAIAGRRGVHQWRPLPDAHLQPREQGLQVRTLQQRDQLRDIRTGQVPPPGGQKPCDALIVEAPADQTRRVPATMP